MKGGRTYSSGSKAQTSITAIAMSFCSSAAGGETLPVCAGARREPYGCRLQHFKTEIGGGAVLRKPPWPVTFAAITLIFEREKRRTATMRRMMTLRFEMVVSEPSLPRPLSANRAAAVRMVHNRRSIGQSIRPRGRGKSTLSSPAFTQDGVCWSAHCDESEQIRRYNDPPP